MGYTDRGIIQKNLYDRVSTLLESYEWSDCSFSVSGKDIKAHRLILGISSPVFKAMFYGPLSTSDSIVISDIEPDIFQLIINYIYTDKVEISSIEHAFELLYASKKYLLEYLTKKCIDYIEANLSVDNVISVLNFSEYIQETSLISNSLKLFCEHAEYLLFENLEKISCSCLKLVLESNEINVSEKNLIKFVFMWTKVCCNLNDVPETFENRRKVLVENNFIKLLKFSVLSTQEIEDIVADENNLLLESEILEKRQECGIKARPRDAMKVRTYMCHRSSVRSAAPLAIDAVNNKVNIRIKADKTVFLNSLCVPTRMSPEINFHSDSTVLYSEQFTVSVILESNKSIIKFTNFMNTVEYDSNIFIEFSEPCVLKKDEWHQISFVWPSNRCYTYKYIVGHRDIASHQKVKFIFEDLDTDGSFLESLKFSM